MPEQLSDRPSSAFQYVDCLNVLQAETLKRIREEPEGQASKELSDALLTTITGIANGMGNTG